VFVCAATKGERRVLFAGDIGISVAVKIEMITAGIETVNRDGDVAAVLGKEIAVIHGVAA
jgi:hypothetical protein